MKPDRTSKSRSKVLKTWSQPYLSKVFSSTVALAVLPGIVFFVLGARSIEPINGQDGYAYIGIVNRTQDFLQRFPDSYFGFRFGYILPSKFFDVIFGFEVGHHLLRFTLLGVVALLFRIKKRLNFTSVVIATVLFSSSPVVLVSTFNTYPMSMGSLYLLIAILIFCTYGLEQRLSLTVFLGSVFLTLAWNSHLQLLAPSVVVFCVITAEQTLVSKKGRVRTVTNILFIGASGAFATCLLAALYYGLKYGVWDLWTPALKFASESRGTFSSSGFGWLTWRHYLLLVPLSLLIGISTWVTESDPILRRLLRLLNTNILGLLLVYSGYQWILKSIALETFFHSSALLIICMALIGLSAAVLVQRQTSTSNLNAVLLILVSLVSLFLGGKSDGNYLLVISLTVILAVLFYLSIVRWTKLFCMCMFTAISLSSYVTVSSPHDFPPTPTGYRTDPLYDQALFSYDRTSMDRAVVIHKMSRLLPELAVEGGEIKIWFDPRVPYDQLSAPFLWYKSSLQYESDPPLPELTIEAQQRLLTVLPQFVVIVTADEDAVRKASKNIRTVANYEERWLRTLRESNFQVSVALLQLKSPTNS